MIVGCYNLSMSTFQLITSLQNPRVKNVVRLSNRRHRDQLGQTLIEGVREASLALQKGFLPTEAFVCIDYLKAAGAQNLVNQLSQLAASRRSQLFEVTPAVYDKMAYRSGSGGILLVIPYTSLTLESLSVAGNPLFAVVDGAEKPGNLGAILRTADAAGLSALLLTGAEGEGTDIYNPNVIRASLGAIFTVPVVTTTREEALMWLQKNQIMTVATTPNSETLYTAISYIGPTAVVMGSESSGLSREWLDAADVLVRIPMLGEVDSLNLSVSTALVLYEALRQRNSMSPGSVLPGIEA
jgi:TrmH family RNA methyltransferase